MYRDAKKVEEMTTRAGNIPAERERNIVKRDGFSYEVRVDILSSTIYH